MCCPGLMTMRLIRYRELSSRTVTVPQGGVRVREVSGWEEWAANSGDQA